MKIVTKEKVFEAATVIAGRGERPMAKQIKQEFFDNKGSLETIQNHLWEWREQCEDASGVKSLPELPAELLEFISIGLRRTIGKIILEADERVQEARKLADEKLKIVSDELQAFVSETKSLEAAISEKDCMIEEIECEIELRDKTIGEIRDKAKALEYALGEQRENTQRAEASLETLEFIRIPR